MNKNTTVAWRQYEAGKEYKRRIGLYENTRRNERYYRGDQWYGSSVPDLPRPVFNIIRRIVDYLVCTVVSGNISILYTNDDLPFTESSAERELIVREIELLSKNASYRWEKDKLEALMYELVLDAALSGDGVLYCYWDPCLKTGQPYTGDIVTRKLDNTSLFVSDVNSRDIQSQDYVILSGREKVSSLRAEARRFGASEHDIKNIRANGVPSIFENSESSYELEDVDSEKATYLIKFYRENGHVVFEKSTRECVIRREVTDMTRYPVTYFCWSPTRNSFHGTSPVSSMIPNQKFINLAYAMVMKHMTDTAFSKVIYDKSKIPEWSNEVGEAIAAVGGGNIADAVSVVGVGQMQNGYTDLIETAVASTKEMNGATETALGNTEPTNTSAILAMQEASHVPLMQVRAAFRKCLEELAAIWADMLLNYYPADRKLLFSDNGKILAESIRTDRLKNALICACVEIGSIEHSTPITTQLVLDKLLDGGHISADTYLSLLPSGVLRDRDNIVATVREDKTVRKEKENA